MNIRNQGGVMFECKNPCTLARNKCTCRFV